MSSPRSMSKYTDIDDRKLKQLGFSNDKLEGGIFENNYEYLRAWTTFGRELLHEARYLTDYPSIGRFKGKCSEYKEVKEALEAKRHRSENKLEERFKSTRFAEEKDLEECEIATIKLLFARRGIGINPHEPHISGETLLHALKMILDLEVEEIRSYLMTSSRLRSEGYIYAGRYPRSRNKREEQLAIEEVKFMLESPVVNALLENEDLEQEEKEDSSKDRGLRFRKKQEDTFLEPFQTEVTLSDVVLPEEIKESIRTITIEKNQAETFYEEWNMKSVVGNRKGLTVLFSGPSGSGKTMTAKALSNHLDQELYMIKFEELVNHWYGQTEKNVNRLFEKIDQEGGMILLDEADAVLKKRDSSKGSTSAIENRIVNIFLQGMENHSGMVIMTTNYAVNMDKALNRRIDLKVEFPIPDENARAEIWDHHIPEEVPLNEGVDLGNLAKKYELTGGQIRNAALNAARRALHDERDKVTEEDFKIACKKEREGEKAMEYSLQEDEKGGLKGYN